MKSAPQTGFWLLCTDLYPALVAASVPWSTSAVAIFMVIWLVVLIPTLDRSLLITLKRPAGFLPVVFFGLALLGISWTGSSWAVALEGLSPVAKLVAIPLFLHHFGRSQRGHWVFVAFLASCILLLGLSWAVFFVAEWKISASAVPGVPVRNSIDQSQEFVLCMFAIAALLPPLLNQRRFALAAGCIALIAAFLGNMMFVVLARTALVCMPVLLILFAVRFLNRRAMTWAFVGAVILGSMTWFVSPYLRHRTEGLVSEYTLWRDTGVATSTGERIEYWRHSIEWIGQAPLLGHGTGSTKDLFDRESAGKTGDWAQPLRNPHNQTMYVAIQWGLLGCVILYAMWYSHLSLFRGTGFAAWIGLIVLVQNFVSSLFNSHLFDFSEGWIYVLGVGVAGAMAAQKQAAAQKQVYSKSALTLLGK
jgi:O-antigen ligase